MSTPALPPPSGPAPWSPPPTAPSAGKVLGLSKGPLVAIVAVVVVVGVVAGLFLTGVIPGLSSSSSSGTKVGSANQTSYSQAAPIAIAEAGSGWVPVYASGDNFVTSYHNTSSPGENASCPLTGGSGSWPTIPAWSGTYDNGLATIWVFFFYESSGPSAEWVMVEGTTATILGSVTGNCVPADYAIAGGLGSGILDSTAVAAAIAGNDSGYVAAHPSANSAFSILSGESYHGFTLFSASWYVLYTTCTPGGGGTGSNFTAYVNASTGAVGYSAWTNGTCGSNALVYGGHGGIVALPPPSARAMQLRRD